MSKDYDKKNSIFPWRVMRTMQLLLESKDWFHPRNMFTRTLFSPHRLDTDEEPDFIDSGSNDSSPKYKKNFAKNHSKKFKSRRNYRKDIVDEYEPEFVEKK